jgi:hypothetical protein
MNIPSIIKILSIYYLLLLNPLSTDLLSHRLKEFVLDNRMIQHIIAVLTIFMLITLFYEKTVEKSSKFLFTMICYIFFIFTTKIELQINIMIILSLIGLYFVETIIDEKNDITDEDLVMSDIEKNKIKTYRQNIKYIFYGLLTISVILGIFFYANKKTGQYGGGFSFEKFFFY